MAITLRDATTKRVAPKREVLGVEAATSANWNAASAEIYDYLSSLHVLLPGLPGLQRLQIASDGTTARLLIGVPVMGQRLNLIMELQARYSPELRRIILTSCPTPQTQLFGPRPAGYFPASLRVEMITKPGRAASQVNARIRLGLAEFPAGLAIFANFFVRMSAETIAREQAQKIINQLMSRLHRGFVESRVA